MPELRNKNFTQGRQIQMFWLWVGLPRVLIQKLIKADDLKLSIYSRWMIATQVCVLVFVSVCWGGCQGLNLWSLQSIFMKTSTPWPFGKLIVAQVLLYKCNSSSTVNVIFAFWFLGEMYIFAVLPYSFSTWLSTVGSIAQSFFFLSRIVGFDLIANACTSAHSSWKHLKQFLYCLS